ncbi:hypothetical protein WJX77_003106 [Trebouxia sp. C0004]
MFPVLNEETSPRVQHKQLMRSGRFQEAIAHYSTEVNEVKREADDLQQLCPHLGLLYCNRALAHLKLRQFFPAMLDANWAIKQDPKLLKAHHRLAQAQLGLERFKAAMQSAQAGQRLLDMKADRTTDFTMLMDRIAMAAAMKADYAGFDGRVLQVRSAGEDAWLGKPAPEDLTLDGPSSHSASLLQIRGGHTDCKDTHLVSRGAASQALTTGSQRTSYRSIKEAMEAACDGDQIILQPGIHNGMGETINITKRILIRGSGPLGETKVDQRANCPTIRITRSAVIMNLEIDMTGFREAVLITGTDKVCPVIQNCTISCSGDDCVNVSGRAQPNFSKCSMNGRKCGLRAFGHSISKLRQCVISECGQQACKASDAAAVNMIECQLKKNLEECIVGMSSSSITLNNCCLQSSEGPAIDMTGTSVLHMCNGSVQDCIGGVWLWEQSSCDLDRLNLHGGASYAISIDKSCKAQLKGCYINGSLHMDDAAWQSVQTVQQKNADLNTFIAAKATVYWPFEEGPFVYEANMLTA